jgi:acetyl-CoA carboxylase alpha subunit
MTERHKEPKKPKKSEAESAEKITDAYDMYLLVRKKERPRARDLIPKIFDKFEQYREGFPYDPNIIAGYAELDGLPLFVIGQNWRTVKDRKILSTITAKVQEGIPFRSRLNFSNAGKYPTAYELLRASKCPL